MREFSSHGYALALVGQGGRLADGLAAVGVAVPDRVIPGSATELREFLDSRPTPAAQRRATPADGRE